MDSATEKEICAICGTEQVIFHRNLKKVKTKFSGTTVFQLLERFSERELSHLTHSCVASGACNDCYAKLNEYDAAYTKALIIQQELTDLLQNGTLQIFEESPESEQDKVAEKSDNDAIQWVPKPVGIEQLTPTMKPSFSIAGLSSMRVSMQCNVCGEVFNNINHMKHHSHGEVNEQDRSARVQQMPAKESSVQSPMLVIESLKTEPTTSADNSDEELDVYLEYPSGELYSKEEAQQSDEYYLSEVKEEAEPTEASQHPGVKKAGPHECLYCEAKFEHKSYLREHFKTKHPQNGEDNVCKVCGFATRTRAALASHYGKHLRAPELVCQVCNKKFTQRASLQRHMAIHTGEKPYQCDVCGKQYIHYSSFYMHGLAHKNVRSKNCTICGYTLRSNSHLIRHMRTHSGEKPYACPVCDQRFSQRYNMMQHQKTHSGVLRRSDKTFSCPYCDYTSARNALLKRHLMKHHGKDVNAFSEKDTKDNEQEHEVGSS